MKNVIKVNVNLKSVKTCKNKQKVIYCELFILNSACKVKGENILIIKK